MRGARRSLAQPPATVQLAPHQPPAPRRPRRMPPGAATDLLLSPGAAGRGPTDQSALQGEAPHTVPGPRPASCHHPWCCCLGADRHTVPGPGADPKGRRSPNLQCQAPMGPPGSLCRGPLLSRAWWAGAAALGAPLQCPAHCQLDRGPKPRSLPWGPPLSLAFLPFIGLSAPARRAQRR